MPQNIYFDGNCHFYLGDFSSAKDTSFSFFRSLYHAKKYCRTGSAPSFLPPNSKYTNNFYYRDLYSFSLLLYLLLHNGNKPSKENKSFFSEIDSVLYEILFPQEKSLIFSPNATEIFLQKLTEAFKSYKENNDLGMVTTLKTTNHKLLPIFYEDTLDLPSEEENILSLLLLRFSVDRKKAAGILFCCFCLFSVSLYHSFSQEIRQSCFPAEVTVIKSSAAPSNETATSSAISKNSITENKKSPTPSAGNSLKTSLPLQSSSPTASPEALAKQILDISGQNLQDNTFLKTEQKNNFKIIFAGKNQFTNLLPFSTLQTTEELYLNDNTITSLHGLAHLKKLKILTLSNNTLKDISPLSQIDSLLLLDLSHNQQLQKIRSLSSLKNLQYLILTNTNIRKKDIAYLKKKLPFCVILY